MYFKSCFLSLFFLYPDQQNMLNIFQDWFGKHTMLIFEFLQKIWNSKFREHHLQCDKQFIQHFIFRMWARQFLLWNLQKTAKMNSYSSSPSVQNKHSKAISNLSSISQTWIFVLSNLYLLQLLEMNGSKFQKVAFSKQIQIPWDLNIESWHCCKISSGEPSKSLGFSGISQVQCYCYGRAASLGSF